MTESESRIYGKNLICICVDEATERDFEGVLWTPYEEEALPFGSGYEMMMLMDRLYDNWDFPQRTTSYRSFVQRDKSRDYHNPNSIRKREPIRSLKTYRGERATFIVQVKFRQNSSWQGQVLWSERKKNVHFRSALELLKLINSALEQSEK